MDYMDFKVSKRPNVLDVPEAEIYTEEGPPIFPMASTKLRHLHGGSLGILDDIAKLDMPDYPMKEVPFGEESKGAAPPTPVGPKSRSVYMTLDRVIKFSETPGCKACERKTRYHTPESRKRFARLVEEEKADLFAKRKEGISVEEIPPPAAEDPPPPPPVDPPPEHPEDTSAAPTVIAGLSITPHTTQRTQLDHTRPESGVPVFGTPAMSEAPQVSHARKKRNRGKKKTPKFNSCMFEFARAPDSQTHKTFLELGIPHVPLSKEHLDLSNPDVQAQLHNRLETCEEVPDLWASIPCTSGSPWQRVNRSKGGARFARAHTQQVRELFAEFTRSSRDRACRGGTVTFEWPKGCESWSRHDVKSFFDAHPEFQLVEFDGCAVGVRSTKGRPIKKTWRLMTTSQRIVDAFSQHKCTHSPHELLVRKLPKLPFIHHKWFVKLPGLCTHKRLT